ARSGRGQLFGRSLALPEGGIRRAGPSKLGRRATEAARAGDLGVRHLEGTRKTTGTRCRCRKESADENAARGIPRSHRAFTTEEGPTMAVGKLIGKEQMILIPLPSSPVVQLASKPLNVGSDAVVLSGYVGVHRDEGATEGIYNNADDDDALVETDVVFLVGPVWRQVIQVSSVVSLAGVESDDADEVDHSLWRIGECIPKGIDVLPNGKRIELTVKTGIKGYGNAWRTLAYHVVATGLLLQRPSPGDLSLL